MPVPAQNQQYENFIIRYKQNTHGGFDYESDETFQIVNDLFGILYVPMQKVPELELSSYSYSSIPRCYTYMDTGALSTSGVTGLHNHPYLKLQGKGTLVAVIDSGIDYLHPAFHNGVQSKIFSIWDQTLEGGADGRIPFGREFGRQQIEQALASENPWEIVPSSDTNGHGTRSAATAAGYRIEKDNFCGAAPEAEIVIVKLKQAKNYLRDFYLLPRDIDIFQEDDIPITIRVTLGDSCKERLNTLIHDTIRNSYGKDKVEMTPEIAEAMRELRTLMFRSVYNNPVAKKEERKARTMLQEMYLYYSRHPEQMSREYQKLIAEGENRERVACDYISGMTDQYAMAKFKEIFIPSAWAVY